VRVVSVLGTCAQRLDFEEKKVLFLMTGPRCRPEDVLLSCALPTPARLFCHSYGVQTGVRSRTESVAVKLVWCPSA